MCYLVLSIS